MSINLQKITACSGFVGFENTNDQVSQTFYTAAGNYIGDVGFDFSFPVDNAKSISRIRINFATQNSKWYQMDGTFSSRNVDLADWPNDGSYMFLSSARYSGGNLVINITIRIGFVLTYIPAQTYNVVYRFFNTPF